MALVVPSPAIPTSQRYWLETDSLRREPLFGTLNLPTRLILSEAELSDLG